MDNKKTITPVAFIQTDFQTRFGIPRQCGLVENEARIVLEKEFSSPDCVRELDGYSHIWLIWGFSGNEGQGWSSTVRPPRLGGNRRVGVFASRSPFRPNGLGLSVVRLLKIEMEKRRDGGSGPVLYVTGADLMNQTPIYDIKPYIPASDALAGAQGGYSQKAKDKHLEVRCSPDLLARLPEEKIKVLFDCLSLDPRPSYQDDPDRVYGMRFAEYDIRFVVRDHEIIIKDIISDLTANS